MALELPGGMRIGPPDPTAQQLAPMLQAIHQQLVGMGNQLDLLVKLECGYLRREDLRRRLEEFDLQQARAAKARETALSNGEAGT